jgi:hypothetical protein
MLCSEPISVRSWCPIRHVAGCCHSSCCHQSPDHIRHIGWSGDLGRQPGDLHLLGRRIGCQFGYHEVHAVVASGSGNHHSLAGLIVEVGDPIDQEQCWQLILAWQLVRGEDLARSLTCRHQKASDHLLHLAGCLVDHNVGPDLGKMTHGRRRH